MQTLKLVVGGFALLVFFAGVLLPVQLSVFETFGPLLLVFACGRSWWRTHSAEQRRKAIWDKYDNEDAPRRGEYHYR